MQCNCISLARPSTIRELKQRQLHALFGRRYAHNEAALTPTMELAWKLTFAVEISVCICNLVTFAPTIYLRFHLQYIYGCIHNLLAVVSNMPGNSCKTATAHGATAPYNSIQHPSGYCKPICPTPDASSLDLEPACQFSPRMPRQILLTSCLRNSIRCQWCWDLLPQSS